MTREEAAEQIYGLILSADDEEGPCIFSDQIEALETAIEVLKQPEIIRCKDCKYCDDYGMGEYYCESEDIVPVGNYVEPYGFCNFARRREE